MTTNDNQPRTINRLPSLLGFFQQKLNDWKGRLNDVKKTFKDHRNKFEGLTKYYKPTEEGGLEFPPETKNMSTSVQAELKWLSGFFIAAVNYALQRDRTNLSAVGTLTLFGKTWSNIPSWSLITLEDCLKELRSAVLCMPVLDSSRTWHSNDAVLGDFQSDEEWTWKTEMRKRPIVKHPGTDKHQPQVELIDVQENIGKWYKRQFSGAISTETKTKVLSILDNTIAEVVSAREEANNIETAKFEDIGSHIFTNIMEPIKEAHKTKN